MKNIKHTFLLIPILMIGLHPVFAQAKTATSATAGTTTESKATQNTKDSKGKTCNILHAENQYYDEKQKKCTVTECDPGYKKNSDATKCVVKKGEQCDSKPDDKATTYVYNELAKCVINECEKGYKPNTLKNKCVVNKGGDCTPPSPADHSMSYEYDEKGSCTVLTACENYYKIESNRCVVDKGKSCKFDVDNFDTGEIVDQSGTAKCAIKKCKGENEPDAKQEKCVPMAPCDMTKLHVTKVKRDATGLCIPQDKYSCAKGYTYTIENGIATCEQIVNGNECSDPEKHLKGTYECTSTECTCKYNGCTGDIYKFDADTTTCTRVKGTDCPKDQLPEHAESGYMDESGKCIIATCKKPYTIGENNSCVEKSDEIKEKEAKVQELKEKEQSLENRMTTAVSMGGAGIGGMMLAESLSEQRVDEQSEQDMAAYIETFRCTYAGGKSVKGGATEVQLPADTLFDLYQEYIALAADVKTMKEQLDLMPGIESEVVMDKATMGLYDDQSSGKTNGTYASLYRALTDESSEDAQQWADQKAKTDKNKKIGIGVGVGAAALGGIGNILTNHVDWDKTKGIKIGSTSEEDPYEEEKQDFKDALEETGIRNIKKLDLSKIDFSVIDTEKIDYSKITTEVKRLNYGNKDATKLNTSNTLSFLESFKNLFGVDIPVIKETDD